MLLKDPRRLPTLLKALFNLLWVQCVTLAGIVNSDNHVAVHPRMTKQVKAVVVAQLVERSLPTPEIHSSNPVIGGFIFTFICATNCIEKMKIQKMRIKQVKAMFDGAAFLCCQESSNPKNDVCQVQLLRYCFFIRMYY